MRVKCIDNKDFFSKNALTLGKEYEVIEDIEECGSKFYRIVADNFNIYSVLTRRFEKVEKEFDWQGFKNYEFVVNCDTEEKANDFLKQLEKNINVNWIDGSKLNEKNSWGFYKNETCYDYESIGITYCEKEYYEKKRKPIIKWEIQEQKDITYRAVEKFGLKQLDIVQEEAAELIQAISKFKREDCNTTRINLLEELADMHIMLRQLEILMNYSDEEVENTITFKKQKLESYLNKRCVFDE